MHPYSCSLFPQWLRTKWFLVWVNYLFPSILKDPVCGFSPHGGGKRLLRNQHNEICHIQVRPRLSTAFAERVFFFFCFAAATTVIIMKISHTRTKLLKGSTLLGSALFYADNSSGLFCCWVSKTCRKHPRIYSLPADLRCLLLLSHVHFG